MSDTTNDRQDLPPGDARHNPEMTGDATDQGLPATAGYGGALAPDAQEQVDDGEAADAAREEDAASAAPAAPAENADVRPAAGDAHQDSGVMDQNDASHEERVEGIVAQTRQDMGSGEEDEVVYYLKSRFRDAGIDLGEDEIHSIARHVISGDAGPWYRAEQ